MLDVRFVPIEKWPGEWPKSVRHAAFKATYPQTLKLLETELRQLRAKAIVIQAYFRTNQIRQDGWPYADARPSRAGVVLSFQSSKGAFSFPCYRYAKFEDNMRAIALSLEALRAVDRYGVTQRAEQYQGWKQLESPGAAATFSSAEEAARFISIKAYGDEKAADSILQSEDARKLAYRSAARLLHPDAKGGMHEEFVLLQQAIAILTGRGRENGDGG
jgi:hypothetical protein